MKMLATKDGFYRGNRIRAGRTFEFDENQEVQAKDRKTGKPQVDGEGRPVMVHVKPPTWAQPADAPPPPVKPAAKAGDTKPPAAQAAAKAKTGAASDSLV